MKSYKTVDAARQAYEVHPRKGDIACILKIVPGIGISGEYVLALGSEALLRAAHKNKPIAGIKSIVGMVYDYDAAKKAALIEARAAEKIRINGLIPGIEILKKAREDEEIYQEAFTQMMEDGGNDGARPPKKPKTDASAIAREYPLAALYLKAEAYTLSNNSDKYSAGKKAKKLLEEKGAEGKQEAESVLKNWLPASAYHN